LIRALAVRDAPLGIEAGEFRGFFHTFLHLVLAEEPLPAGMGFRDRRRRNGLAHRDERNVIGPPASSRRGARDALPNGLQVAGDCGHNFRRLTRRGSQM
jgi:hypothetical protein